MTLRNKITTVGELRKFGLSVGGVFLLIGGLSFYLEKEFYLIPTIIGAILFVFGLILPESLKAVFYWWMKFAEKISIVSTFILLAISFFIVMLPIGILLKLIRKDVLSLKLDRSAKSYWISASDDQREERYTTPY